MEEYAKEGFYPQGWERKGYMIPLHMASLASDFEKRWRWIFKVFLGIAVASMIVFHRWGVAASLIGGLLIVLSYNSSVQRTFSSFETSPPRHKTGSLSKYMLSRARDVSYFKIICFYAIGFIIVRYTFLSLFMAIDAGLIDQAINGLGLIFGIGILANTAFLTGAKIVSAWKSNTTC